MGKLAKLYKLPIRGKCYIRDDGDVVGDDDDCIRPDILADFIATHKDDPEFELSTKTILYDMKNGICIVEVHATEEVHGNLESYLSSIKNHKMSFVVDNPKNIQHKDAILCNTSKELLEQNRGIVEQLIPKERMSEILKDC